VKQLEVLTGAEESTRSVDDCWNRIGVRGNRTCIQLRQYTHCRNCPSYAAAAAHLLDREMPEGHRRAWTLHYTATRRTAPARIASALVFRVGAEWLALPTGSLCEVTDPRPIRALPNRRGSTAAGLVNVRGDLVVHVSLAELLGIDTVPPASSGGRGTATPRLIVAGNAMRRLAFSADAVSGVFGYDPKDLRPAPSTLARGTTTYTVGILQLEGKAIGCLDPERTLRALTAGLA
jgi:chemotaxis-related protein WspD